MQGSRLSPEELTTLASYERLAETRSKVINGTPFNREFWRPEFERFSRLLPSGRILDIGCGNGREALLFRNAGYQYTGVDLSAGMLTEARKLDPGATLARASMYELPFPDHSFDGVWNCCTIFHAPKSRVGMALKEMVRVAKPGAPVFLAIKEGVDEQMVEDFRGGNERFFSFYDRETFRTILIKNGLQMTASSRDLREYNPPKCTNVYLLYFAQVL